TAPARRAARRPAPHQLAAPRVAPPRTEKLPTTMKQSIVLAMIITVGHDKGGVGKTTTATNLAVWFAHRGADVLLLDADRQGASAHWATKRGEDTRVPPVRWVQASGNISATVRDLARRYQHIVIDTGGHDSLELRSALLVSHILVTPLRPSEADLRIVENVAVLVASAQALNPGLSASVLLNFVPTNMRNGESADAREALAHHHAQMPTLSHYLSDRKAYRDGYRGGWGAIEMDDAKAAAEVAAVAEEIHGQTTLSDRIVSAAAL
ncbi:MAG: AAA family ATPase, partial [Solirubrobacterales bacterium]